MKLQRLALFTPGNQCLHRLEKKPPPPIDDTEPRRGHGH